MSESSPFYHLWMDVREPTLMALTDVISYKAEHGRVEPLNYVQHKLRGFVVRFLRGYLDYFRDDNLPDLYCKDVWSIFCELHRIISNVQNVGPSNGNPEPVAFLLLDKIDRCRPELFQGLSAIVHKYIALTKQFREKEGEAMYKVRRRTNFLGVTCGRVFGFIPHSFRCENICYNEKVGCATGDEMLEWLFSYIWWLKNDENFDYFEGKILPDSEHIAVCGFRGMTGVEEICGEGDYYGEFSYMPLWDRRIVRGTRGIGAWFKYHLNQDQKPGLMFTTESVRRGRWQKDLCCFWPSKVDVAKAWPEECFLPLADDYIHNVEEMGDEIWYEPEYDTLENRKRIAMLEMALYLEDRIPWTYYHLANEYRKLNEEWIYGDLVRQLWCSPTLAKYAPRELIERLEDEYSGELREYLSDW